jgi:hypothetical protein
MPLKKLMFKPGINRELTRYAAEGGWYDGNNVRFRYGYPEKIGGWERLSANLYLGVCRSLFNWSTLGGQNLVGVGTNWKFYIERDGVYYDITPIRSTVTLSDPFDTTDGSPVVTVTDTGHGAITNDFVTFSGATAVGGLDLNAEYQITRIDDDSYTITAGSNASSTANGGGATVEAEYQLNTGSDVAIPLVGWGAGPYSSGPWGMGSVTTGNISLWTQSNFGEDLIFCTRNGPICYWDASTGTSVRGTLLEDAIGASDVPLASYGVLVSDVSRFVLAFGCNELGESTLDPMLIRWSDQENAVNWTPAATNQAGGIRLSSGSEIMAYTQARQEILVWTDCSLYSLQYVGAADGVWAPQIVGDNISIVSPNAMAYSNGVAYWMGNDKFYKYDGSVSDLPCDVRRYVFSDFNREQRAQTVCGNNEAFNELWWFFCSAGSTVVDRYVVHNYVDRTWYYGEFGRTAWIDSKLRQYPIAATYVGTLVHHELGVDDKILADAVAIPAFIESTELDLDDGQRFLFVWRVLPDVMFAGSESANPILVLSLTPMKNSGSGYLSPASVGGESAADIERTVEVPIEKFTGAVNIRLRGRQCVLRYESTEIGIAWQVGGTRIDFRYDGRQ